MGMNTIQRQAEIRSLKLKGKSSREIGDMYGLSRQRVDQILVKDYSSKKIIDVTCACCGKEFVNDSSHFRKFCSVCSPQVANLDGRERTRELVRIRDNHTCQKCNLKWDENMRRFDVHHLDGICGKKSRGYDSSKDISKLITLCHKCHMGLDEVRLKIKNKSSPRISKPLTRRTL